MTYIPNERALEKREKEKQDPSDLINYLSSKRKSQIEQFYKNDPKIFELERKYGKYLTVPLDIPVFEIPDKEHFMYWWKKYAIRPIKQKGDYVAPDKGFSPFESIDLVQKVGEDWNLNLQTENFKKEFPHLWQQFYDQLPCDDILVFNLWSSVQEFTEHRDSAEMYDLPSSFRIKLYDENPEETLFVFDNPIIPYHCEEPTFLSKLETTNTHIWNNFRVKHGSVYDHRYKKVLGVVVGLLNLDKYEEVMERSINRYKEHCLISKYSIENYINV